LSAKIFKEAYAGIVPKVIKLYVTVEPDLIKLAVVFTVYPEVLLLFDIWQLFMIMVDDVGHVNNEPEEEYEPDPALPDIEAVKFNPVFLYIFGIILIWKW
jgi:hypothetical protein